MSQHETINDFYKRILKDSCLNLSELNTRIGHVNIFSRDNCATISPYSRRDYYKVSLIIGTGTLHYADKWIYINKPALLFSNPIVPYSWEAESEKQEGWFCLFTDAFIEPGERKGSLQESPLFSLGANPVYFLDEAALKEVSDIFMKMQAEIQSNYPHKYNVIKNYLHLLIHQAMKLSPTEEFKKQINASTRICGLFLELLERQFPIDTPANALQIKTAQDFANSLSVHVNHLNRSVKEISGKTTTEHIASRITQEAKALLQHTDWNIAEIGYSLGFQEPAYFTNFFKKNTGITPNTVRLQMA